MISATNMYRAERGGKLQEYHQLELMEDFGTAGVDCSAIASLLADLRHFCNQNEIDFDAAITLSEIHFNEEIAGCDDYLDDDEESEDETHNRA